MHRQWGLAAVAATGVLLLAAGPAQAAPAHGNRFAEIDQVSNQPGRAKLTEAQAAEIRRAPGLNREIARAYGISKTTVGEIKRGEKWKRPAREAGGFP